MGTTARGGGLPGDTVGFGQPRPRRAPLLAPGRFQTRGAETRGIPGAEEETRGKESAETLSRTVPGAQGIRVAEPTLRPATPGQGARASTGAAMQDGCYRITESQNHRITESQNHRIVGVGRDLCGSHSPTLMPKQVTQSRLHRTLSRQGLNVSREGDSTASLGSLGQGSVTLRGKTRAPWGSISPSQQRPRIPAGAELTPRSQAPGRSVLLCQGLVGTESTRGQEGSLGCHPRRGAAGLRAVQAHQCSLHPSWRQSAPQMSKRDEEPESFAALRPLRRGAEAPTLPKSCRNRVLQARVHGKRSRTSGAGVVRRIANMVRLFKYFIFLSAGFQGEQIHSVSCTQKWPTSNRLPAQLVK